MDHPGGLDALLAVAAATLNEQGELVEANAGFRRLLRLAGMASPTAIAGLLIQPSFPVLLNQLPDPDGLIYQGLLTMGEYTGQTRTLRARIWRKNDRVEILAEVDVEDLERVNTTVLQLNQDYSQAQLQLAQANLTLRATNTLLRETQKKLVEAEKMASLGVLVAGVAHEISTPLGVCLSATSVLQDQSRLLSESFAARSMTQTGLTRYLKLSDDSCVLINRNLERIGRLIDSFRQVAVGGKSLEKHSCRLRDCLDNLVERLDHRLTAAQVELQIDCPADLLVEGSNDDWSVILGNLIDNSLKHGFRRRERGRIEILVTQNAHDLRVDYADDGIGLTEATQARIFDPFFTTDLQHGMGLGMHLVYNLITHRLGGTISCVSTPGNGVCVHMNLPS